MPPEMKNRMKDASKMGPDASSKKNVKIVAAVVLMVIIVWQVWDVIPHGNGGSVPPPPMVGAGTAHPGIVATIKTTNPAMAPAATPTVVAPTTAMANTPAVTTAVQPDLQSQVVSPEITNQIMKMQADTQIKYVSALNELQMLKIQREIAEANQAIATANLNEAKAKAERTTADNSAASSTVQLPPARPIAMPVMQAPPQPAVNMMPMVSYVVLSVAMQAHKWTAVINSDGKLYNVSIGDSLPVDGSVVTAIDKDGVTLIKDGKEKKIAVNSAL